jgi:hypothetical protein
MKKEPSANLLVDITVNMIHTQEGSFFSNFNCGTLLIVVIFVLSADVDEGFKGKANRSLHSWVNRALNPLFISYLHIYIRLLALTCIVCLGRL